MLKSIKVATLLALSTLGLCLMCERAKPGATKGEHGKNLAGVLATVNGTPITERDVANKIESSRHGGAVSAGQEKNVLETVIRQELYRQRAEELGLDADAKYQERLQAQEAQLNAFKREALAQIYLRDMKAKTPAVTDEEVAYYFAKHQKRLQTDLHLWQILTRERAAADEALAEIKAGAAFEEVAARPFPALPQGRKPWDLGYLKWKQIPKPWLGVVDKLEEGEFTEVITGPGNRFWIVKLMDKRVDPTITAESAKPAIVEVLADEKLASTRGATLERLKKNAAISYTDAERK